MIKKLSVKLLFMLSIFSLKIVNAQEIESEFVGESFLLKSDNSKVELEKEIADYTSGISWATNSFNALTLEIPKGKSDKRFSSNEYIQIIVKAIDNNSDPLTIVSIYKLKSKKNKRTVLLSEDNSGTLLKSKTHSKELIKFSGKKYGTSSYLIKLNDLSSGEYGIIVSNPNSKDEKRTIISTFGID